MTRPTFGKLRVAASTTYTWSDAAGLPVTIRDKSLNNMKDMNRIRRVLAPLKTFFFFFGHKSGFPRVRYMDYSFLKRLERALHIP